MSGNPWKRLLALIPGDPVLVGESQGPNGDGTTDVELLGGGLIVATGDGYPLSQPVFVKGGIITGEAPSLTAVDITV